MLGSPVGFSGGTVAAGRLAQGTGLMEQAATEGPAEGPNCGGRLDALRDAPPGPNLTGLGSTAPAETKGEPD